MGGDITLGKSLTRLPTATFYIVYLATKLKHKNNMLEFSWGVACRDRAVDFRG